jgi:hypothetical protein
MVEVRGKRISRKRKREVFNNIDYHNEKVEEQSAFLKTTKGGRGGQAIKKGRESCLVRPPKMLDHKDDCCC